MLLRKKTICNVGVMFVVLASLLAGEGGNAKAEFIIERPVNLGPLINSDTGDGAPTLSADGLELFFTSLRSGGSGSADLWTATRSRIQDTWGLPINLGPTVNSSAWDEAPSISADGLSLFFDSPRPGGQGEYDLWLTTRASLSAPWEPPTNLGAAINSASSEFEPFITLDGLSLYFASDRPGGYGGYDLWVTHRATVSDSWLPPVNLGPTINTARGEGNPSVSASGLVLFLGDFHGPLPGGFGGSDIWVSMRMTTGDAWGAPINLGQTVNTSSYEHGANISADGSTLHFFSNRPGGQGDYDLWQSTIHPLVDFKGDYKIDIEDLIILIEHWGHNEPAFDMGPTPLGDGTVDRADLEVLMSYWGQELDDPNLLSHWKLDETEGEVAADKQGNCDADVVGGAIWQPKAGWVNGAIELDGVDDHLVTDFVIDPSKGPMSVFAWIKGGAPGQAIVSQGMPNPMFGSTWLGTDPDDGRLVTGHMYPIVPMLESDVVITDNQWHRVGLVWDGTLRHLYVDGEEVVSDPDKASHMPSPLGLHIGADSHLTEGSFWSGLIDDVRIYDRAVTP